MASSRSGSIRPAGKLRSRAIAAAWARASRLPNRCPTWRLCRLALAWAESDSRSLSRPLVSALWRSWRFRPIWSRWWWKVQAASVEPMATMVVRTAAAMLAPASQGLRRHHRPNCSTTVLAGPGLVGRSGNVAGQRPSLPQSGIADPAPWQSP